MLKETYICNGCEKNLPCLVDCISGGVGPTECTYPDAAGNVNWQKTNDYEIVLKPKFSEFVAKVIEETFKKPHLEGITIDNTPNRPTCDPPGNHKLAIEMKADIARNLGYFIKDLQNNESE